MEKVIRQVCLSERDRAIRIKLAIVMVIFFVSIAMWMASTIYRQAENGVQSSKWPVAKGHITSSELTLHIGRHRRGSTPEYNPNIHYVYKINGIEYKGQHLTFMNSDGGKAWAEQKITDYPVGKQVNVYYKPQNPTISVLEPGATMKWLILASVVTLIFCVVFLLLAYVFYRDYKKVKNARQEGEKYYI